MTRRPLLRPAFTLVELLVAMAIGIALLALAVAVSQSSAFESYKVVGAGDRLSQWMLTAKNQAARARAPRGIRLLDPNNTGLVREVAYIEQPDPIPSNGPMLLGSRLIFFYPADVQENTTATPATVTVTHLENQRGVFLAGLTTQQQIDFASVVQAGDLISVPELRTVLKLAVAPNLGTDVNATFPGSQAGFPALRLSVATTSLPDLGKSVYTVFSSTQTTAMGPVTPDPNFPPATAPNNGTVAVTAFGVIRAPRPLLGEPTLLLPSGMAVDIRTSLPTTPPTPIATSLNVPPATTVLPDNSRDILFGPSGEVIGGTEALTALLVRDAALPNVNNPLAADFSLAGQMILVCIYNRTGAIATQPVNPPPAADPYSFAKDGINTGL